MRNFWKYCLPFVGLSIFVIISMASFRRDRELHKVPPSRYFYWSSFRLDRDPLNRHPLSNVALPCDPPSANCVEWDPETLWIEPGWPTQILMYTAFPAFIAEGVVLAVFSRLGLNEITIFISSMPLLVAAWFFLVGYWIDRLRIRKLKTKSMRTL